ncbi:MAG TPA: YggS family pyridoxal phosphate-dependent enzyme [Gallionellaceae bacterium]|nr:YggS family pyridoxal phosphate-dependent enzyme [Gallionellaceae bacterium]
MTAILSNLQAVHVAMDRAALMARRDAAQISLLAVSKTVPARVIREAYGAGQTAFGENYVQEALDKMHELRDLPLQWHFIGPIQSNKTRSIAENFSWVHSVDRLKIAERLAEQRPANLPPLNICLQINVSGEASKGGVAADEAEALARAIAVLPGLKLRGLMAIPAPAEELSSQRAPFAKMRELLNHLNTAGLHLDTLSMGMSHDMTAAILEGSTIVRVGTAIFGRRD